MSGGARILDGKAMAARLRERIAEGVIRLKAERAIVPGLAVILVGEDPASQVYVRAKRRQSETVGIHSIIHRLPASVGEEELLETVRRFNADDAVHGILVQLPLPEGIDEAAVIEAIDPAKDVDGFHPVNMGRLVAGAEAMVPCTPYGCLLMLRQALGGLAGRRALVLGRSNIVGKPMALLLLAESCTVTIAHSKTRDLEEECRRAEILVVATGRPRLVRGSWIRPGAAVIDVGINRVETDDGATRLIGDVAFDEALPIAGAITPVPGGVGPMTVACLLRNTLIAACRQAGAEPPDI
jgi:methylenetetrahydrofolate dehydrogenase (NADP+)/methenyltetrahydrofolate cyclohydrolase